MINPAELVDNLVALLRDIPELVAEMSGDEVEAGGVRYKVFDIEADTEGAAVLKLRQAG